MQTIVVTGSASGIGAATSALLVEQGHRVVGVDRRDADVIADLSSADGRAAAIAGILAKLDALGAPGLDGFVPCAGVTNLAPEVVLNVNYLGTIELLRGLRETLAKGTDPAVVLIASNSISMLPPGVLSEDAITALMNADIATAATMAPGYLAYPLSKLALVRFARTHGVGPEWAGAGIRVNAVAPGIIDTPMTQGLEPAAEAAMRNIPIPHGSFGSPQQIANVIAFLLSPAAAFVHGSVWFVDGGTDAVMAPMRL